jgi:hypothetical protein
MLYSVDASMSVAARPSEGAMLVPLVMGIAPLSCFIFQPSTLSFQATFPILPENSLDGFAGKEHETIIVIFTSQMSVAK